MKRHDSLIPLTHDHHHALVQVRRLREAARGTEEDKLSAARAFLDFFASDTLVHFREEEEIVFPLVADRAEARPGLEKVMVEHLLIHAAVGRLGESVRAGVPSPESLRGVADLLEGHVRFEEKTLFPLIESLVADELQGVALNPRDRS